ncbi:Crp/Fnr family transcriptional regulator [Deinococcus aquaticus]|uniref:Crp/Fnr family transcriptional regulator n=1 Tax=Deinococcus aquaticus TaxID=328692 RepID=A0ABY7V2S8_9DEIO|nr:Crp/Fnr family transcriptional regulator [Deinococcus aquaticus]WDA59488.1 Crp/Fnr family transcriptional regulator [Deinococcus aquaticus]
MPIPDALSLLTRTPLFQGADRDTLAGLAGPAHVMTFGRGDAVFRAGDPADTLFIVAVGSVRIYRVGRGGRELTLGIDSSRQVLEPASVLGGETRHAAHAQALATPTVLLSFPADLVRHAVQHTPALAGAVIAHLARRDADTHRRLDALVFSGVGERLAAYLLEHAPAPHALPTNSDLAALLGTVPEIVSRKLGDFYRLGWIDLTRRTVTVTDERELQRLSEGL